MEKFTTAVDYLEFYDSADVPCIDRKSIPSLLSDISFTSDLSGFVDVRRRADEKPAVQGETVLKIDDR